MADDFLDDAFFDDVFSIPDEVIRACEAESAAIKANRAATKSTHPLPTTSTTSPSYVAGPQPDKSIRHPESSVVKVEISNSKSSKKQKVINNFFKTHDNGILLRSKPPSGPAQQAVFNENEYPPFNHALKGEWIYPVDKPKRDYQYKIAQACLLKNTLVSLPTGLGKTLIASVAIYNFYRWFPTGLILFLAPTKPLITQQLNSCHHAMSISSTDLCEMTGSILASQRAKLWPKQRIVFLTPQTLFNDLDNGLLDPKRIVLVVVDEAHHATGAHSYVTAVQRISAINKRFRIIGLSATPGSGSQTLATLVENLNLAHVEIRTESSPDVESFVHNKKEEVITVKMTSDMQGLCEKIEALMVVYIKRVLAADVFILSDPSKLSPYAILQTKQRLFAAKGVGSNNFANPKTMMAVSDLTALHKLASAYDSLSKHDMSVFISKLDDVIDGGKSDTKAIIGLRSHPIFQDILRNYIEKYKIIQNLNCNHASGIPSQPGLERNQPANFLVHPKLLLLEQRLNEHFSEARLEGKSTRVIIFSELRDSVDRIASWLKRNPQFRPSIFIGQASGTKKVKGYAQKQQVEILQQFKNNEFNILVSTCIGEEGLDIGEVDLIVCYDSGASTTRTIQRTGRTGRNRAGKTLTLVMEGREANKYETCKKEINALPNELESLIGKISFYKYNQEMVPSDYPLVVKEMRLLDPASSPSNGLSMHHDSLYGNHRMAPKPKFPQNIFNLTPAAPKCMTTLISSKPCYDSKLTAKMDQMNESKHKRFLEPSFDAALDLCSPPVLQAKSMDPCDISLQDDMDVLFDFEAINEQFTKKESHDAQPHQISPELLALKRHKRNLSYSVIDLTGSRSFADTLLPAEKRIDNHQAETAVQASTRPLPAVKKLKRGGGKNKLRKNAFILDEAEDAFQSQEELMNESDEEIMELQRRQRHEDGIYTPIEDYPSQNELELENMACLADSFINEAFSSQEPNTVHVPYDRINESLDEQERQLRTPINLKTRPLDAHLEDTPGAIYGHDDLTYRDLDGSESSFIVEEGDSQLSHQQQQQQQQQEQRQRHCDPCLDLSDSFMVSNSHGQESGDEGLGIDSQFERRVCNERQKKLESVDLRFAALNELKKKRNERKLGQK